MRNRASNPTLHRAKRGEVATVALLATLAVGASACSGQDSVIAVARASTTPRPSAGMAEEPSPSTARSLETAPEWVDGRGAEVRVVAFNPSRTEIDFADPDGVVWAYRPETGRVGAVAGNGMTLYFTTVNCRGRAYIARQTPSVTVQLPGDEHVRYRRLDQESSTRSTRSFKRDGLCVKVFQRIDTIDVDEMTVASGPPLLVAPLRSTL